MEEVAIVGDPSILLKIMQRSVQDSLAENLHLTVDYLKFPLMAI